MKGLGEPRYKTLADWLASRPPIVRRLLTRWPLGSVVTDGERRFYVIGAAATAADAAHGGLIVSPVHPAADYDAAMAQRVFICGDCLAAGRIHYVEGP